MNKIRFCLCALIAIFVIPSVIFAASFDCSKASTKTEKAVCDDSTLSKLDDDLSVAYDKALKVTDRDSVKKVQRKWLKETLAPCREDKECIKKAYENRLRQLAQSDESQKDMLGKAEKKVVVNTPQKISAKTVCPTDNKWKIICDYFNKYQSEKYTESLNKRNIEKKLGEVCVKGNKEECEIPNVSIDVLYKKGINKDDEQLNYLIKDLKDKLLSNYPYDTVLRASLVDVDNDGIEEIRLWRYVGSAYCEHNYFWKKDTMGTYKFIDVKGYDDLAEEGSGCGAHLIFVPYMKSIYTLYIEDQPPDHIPRISEIWKGIETELIRACTLCN
jgi:uncharacterized protein